MDTATDGNKDFPRMNIIFPNTPPIDPMDGDYLSFEASTDGPPIKCFVTFSTLMRDGNDPEKAKAAFARRRRIHHTAKLLIDAGRS